MTAFTSTTATVAVSLALGLLVGGLIGHFGTLKNSDDTPREATAADWKADDDINHRIVQLVDRDKLRAKLRILTKKPHLATTQRDTELAELVRDTFKAANFDEAYLEPYNVFLSLPDPKNPNKITWMNGTGSTVFKTQHMEKVLHEDDADPDFVHAFNAYSPAAVVKTGRGQGLVYVNYGREEDFERLTEMGVSVAGHIVIARYGKIYRGNKVQQAQNRGAKGVILFSDPRDVAPNGTNPEDVYPNSWWLPGSGMQRGSIYMKDGDPLTPGWPSTEHAYRIPPADAGLPTIPSQPIGYDDARKILEKMGGQQAPEEWIGGLKGVEYNLGPIFKDEYANYTLRIATHNKNSTKMSYNAFGIIKGSVEPDRYVLFGNHRDAWGYGAADPSSGTAQLLETARVFGVLMKDGWRPRRTIVFCSWGAEEFGLIGSSEWVEEHLSKLQQRAVLYLNTDTCVAGGPILNVAGSPLVWEATTTLTKLMPGVAEGKTLYNEWAEYHREYKNNSEPEVEMIGTGSDHSSFAFYAGVPSMDLTFEIDRRQYDVLFYPFYHTGYETFYMVEKFVDPDFRITQGCSRLAALTVRYFADSRLLPFSLTKLTDAMTKALDGITEIYGERLTTIYPDFVFLVEALKNMTMRVEEFDSKLKEKNLDSLNLRAVNDQLMAIERLFIIPAGLPDRPMSRHAIFAPSQFDGYSGQGFPGIVDLLYKIDDLRGEELKAREKAIRIHVSQVTFLVQSVTDFLQDFHLI